MNFDCCPEFSGEVKRLGKKWRSIDDDIKDAMIQIDSLYIGDNQTELDEYRAAFFNNKRASILSKLDDGREVIKMRLDVASLGKNDKVRLIFIVIRNDNKILFVELFAKNEKPREDQKRINKYLK